MLSKLKVYLAVINQYITQYGGYIQGALILILGGAFLFEKAKKDEAEAAVAEEKTLAQVKVDQQQIAGNDAQLASEEQTRTQIQKDADAAKSDNADPTDFLSKR